MKRILLFAFLFVCLFASCKTAPSVAPDNSGEITGTQSEVAAGAATVTAGAETLEGQAGSIAETLGNLAANDPALVSLASQAASHAAAAKKHAAEARKLEADVAKARLEVVAFMSRAAQLDGLYNDEKVKKEKAEGQRNTLAAILGGLALAATVFLFFKIKSGFP